jgi:hypothetical protein
MSIDFTIPYFAITGSFTSINPDICFSSSINRPFVSNAVVYISKSFDRNLYWDTRWQYLTISPPVFMSSAESLIASFTCFGINEEDVIVSVALTA